MGHKGSFEAFVTVSDPDASAKLAKYKQLLPDMEQNLPIPDGAKAKRGGESPIRVVDLVFTSGEARKSVQTIAFNLPNDERVRAEKARRKSSCGTSSRRSSSGSCGRFAERIIDPSQLSHLSAEAFFNETLFHELSHSLGPAFTNKPGEKIEVRKALEASAGAIEECKADVMGAYNILYMIQRKEFPAEFREKLLLSYFAGLFRSTRFGVSEAHGQGAALQINRYLEEGAAREGAPGGRFTVDFAKLEASIGRLVHEPSPSCSTRATRLRPMRSSRNTGSCPSRCVRLCRRSTAFPSTCGPAIRSRASERRGGAIERVYRTPSFQLSWLSSESRSEVESAL